MPVTRFAPSPTGLLHLGHAFAAGVAFREASPGQFLLRLEDIDQARARPEYETAIDADLSWLGLSWQQPVRKQSEHFNDYQIALDKLSGHGLLYPCFCTRRDIANAGQAPHGPDGPLYPGTCRAMDPSKRADLIASGVPYALRMDIDKASTMAGANLRWVDLDHGDFHATPEIFGDVVLARKDTPASYHLCVVVDDALQGITRVTRGEDLLPATHLHRLIQSLLDLPVPEYRHHRLIVDEQGKRLAKRDQARSLHSLRDEGWTPKQVWEAVGRPDLAP